MMLKVLAVGYSLLDTYTCTNIPYLEELHQLHVMSIDIEYSLCGHPYKRSVGGFALSIKRTRVHA